jgi:hypothetical protein
VSDIESSLGLSSNEFKNFMVYVGSYGETMKIYKDTETGVYYIVYTTDNGCCITPRYNISGSLYVD